MGAADAKPIPVLFRTEASEALGLGHLQRCMNFVDGLHVPVAPSLLLRTNSIGSHITKPLLSRGWNIYSLSDTSVEADATQTIKIANQIGAKLVITDLCHREMLETPKRLIQYHHMLKELGDSFIVSIEDWRVEGFASHLAIVPYPSPPGKLRYSFCGCDLLAGLKYYICHYAFSEAWRIKRIISDKPRNILVCISGSDIKGVTIKVVKAIYALPYNDLNVHVVIGGGASSALKHSLESICSDSKYISLRYNVPNMAEEMIWADVGVIGEGLIKYEAAIAGMPSIMISQFDHDSVIMRQFKEYGTTWHIGSEDSITIDCIASCLMKLMSDYELRSTQSCSGKSAIDGHGIKRIEDELRKRGVF